MSVTVRTSESRCLYDSFMDILYVKLRDAEVTDGVDTSRGFIVHYTWPMHELAGITIMDFRERFGEDVKKVEVDSDPPMVLVLDEQACLHAGG